jgi:hypothetical protein
MYGALGLLISSGSVLWAKNDQIITTGVIFSAETAVELARIHPDFFATLSASPPYWTPSGGDIERLERDLRTYLSTIDTAEARTVNRDLANYKRQYVGFAALGRKWILINAFCETQWTRDASWTKEIVWVFEGGSCYFHGRYEISTSHFYGFWINGES